MPGHYKAPYFKVKRFTMKTITKAPILFRGGDYNPDQWLDRPDILEKDVELMKKAGMNTATLGVFAWAKYEPQEGEYDFAWLRETMDRLYAAGIYTELATPCGAKPNWMAKKYPEILRVQANGATDHQGMRHNACPSSPIYREKVHTIIEKLVEAVGDHPGLILWHISNELGGDCYCPRCQARFRDWLRDKYKTIDALNHAWWTGFWSHHYNDFDEIEPPFENGEQSLLGLKLDWRRFTTWNMTDYVHSETELLHKLTPNVPITTNLMEYFPGLDYHYLQKELDFVCWDSYPHWGRPDRSITTTFAMTAFDHALIRGCKRDVPFFTMESTPSLVNWHEYNKLKRPGVNRLQGLQTVACGGDGVQYFQWRKGRGGTEQWHGAVVDHDGRDDTRVFKDVTETNAALNALTPVIGSLPRAEAALIFDWDSRWALEDAWGMQIQQKNLRETVCALHEQLGRCGVDADVIGVEESLDRYKIVVLPMLYMVKPGFGEKIRQFVANGGTVIGTYLLGYVNDSTLAWLGGFPGDGLREVFGVTATELDTLYPGERNTAAFPDGSKAAIQDYCELLETADNTDVLATYGEDFYKGYAVATHHAFGKGHAYYVAARMDADGNAKVFRAAMAQAGCTMQTLPEGVEYHCREDERAVYHFYLNTTETDKTVAVPTGADLLTGKTVSGEVTLGRYGACAVEVVK